MSADLNLPDADATSRLGAALAVGAIPGRTLYLSGDLGAGKTTLVRGLLRALGHAGTVKSPTYTLVEPYALSKLHLYHFDFYRFKDRSEWLNSGFREYFNGEAFCIVEWPEKAGGLLAPPDLHLRLEFADSGRRARVEANTPAGRSWASSLRFS